MRQDIENIKILCETYRTEPKVLIIPSRSMKAQILKTLTDYGIYPLNLAVKSIKELAFGIAENDIKKNKLKVIDSREITDYMTDLLKSLQTENSLRFFNKVEVTFGICRAITKTVLELLENGYVQGNVNLDKIVNSDRQIDLKTIIDEYVKWKKENNYIDYTDIEDRANSILEHNKSEYISGYALRACEFSALEGSIIEKLNIRREKATHTEYSSGYELNLRAKEVNFFDTYGVYNEAKETLRIIFKEKLPFDNVLIVAPSTEPYSQLFYQMMQQYTYANGELPTLKELPVTFGTGLPLLLSSPAKLLMLLLDWIGSDYRSHEFINIFSSDMFDIKADQRDSEGKLPDLDEQFGKLSVINIIKNSTLTWQRQSYIPCLSKHLDFLKEQNYENNKMEKAALWLIKFVEEAFRLIPKTADDATIDIDALLESLKSIIRRYNRIYSAFDSQGRNAILQELNTSIKGRRVNLNEAIEIIKTHMKGIRIMCESPMPGKIHFTPYNQAAWIERNNIFVIGLGADNFPGTPKEDPLLLDAERMSPPMLTSADRINKNIEIMYSLIENISGILTCGYSSFDTVEIRECYPTTLFHRLAEKYPSQKVNHSGFVLDNEARFIDGNDYLLHHGVKNGAVICEEISAEESPETPMWQPDEQVAEQELTATSLLVYLQCKYKYFLKHVLHLREIKSDDFDALGWLTPIETGNVYHKIFEKFILCTIKTPKLLQDKDAATERMLNIAEDEIAVFEEDLPTASSFHTQRQRDEIMNNAVKFVEYEVAEGSNRYAKLVEFAFGEDDPVVIDLGEGRKIKAAGKIDRIDRLVDGSLEIIDYKTGSAYTLKDLKSTQEVGINEANAQLILYYLVLKELVRNGDIDEIKNDDEIRNISYRFLTAKGNYDIISLPLTEDSEASSKAAFLDVCKEIEKGVFAPEKGKIKTGDDKERKVNCKYCGFNGACKFAFADEE